MRDGTLTLLVVVLALAAVLAVLWWALQPYLAQVLETIERIAP